MNTTLSPVYDRVQPWHGEPVPTEGIPAPQAVWQWLESGTIILWTHAGIAVGVLEAPMTDEPQATVPSLEPIWKQGGDLAQLNWQDHLVELRAFNQDKEWRVLANGKGRQRTDESGRAGGAEAVDSNMVLRGVVGKCLQERTETLTLQTRHYLGQNGRGMTVYEDMRIVGIAGVEEGGER